MNDFEQTTKSIKELSIHIQDLVLASATMGMKVDNLEGSTTEKLEGLAEGIQRLQELVHEGNGQVPLVTRVALTEDRIITLIDGVKATRRWIYGTATSLFVVTLAAIVKVALLP